MVLVEVGPGQMLDEETIFVAVTLAPDRGHSRDVETESAGRLGNRFGCRRSAGERRWLNGEGLTALVALDGDAEMLLRDLTGRYAVRAVGLDGHSRVSAGC